LEYTTALAENEIVNARPALAERRERLPYRNGPGVVFRIKTNIMGNGIPSLALKLCLQPIANCTVSEI